MKKRIIKIYLGAIIIYGIIVSLFTSTVHVEVDEEIYLALAHSFHYLGKFEINGMLTDYNCVLYSVIISIAYFFYSPEHILLIMRIIGVLLMCSAVFPIFLLAKKVLGKEEEVTKVCILSLVMPYMFDCAYIMQEVLSYPLFMWTVYFIYCSYEMDKDNDKSLIWAAVFSALAFFAKTYLFFIPIVMNLCLCLEMGTTKRIRVGIRKSVLYSTVYAFCVGILYVVLWIINGCAEGTNHYALQFTNIFPITGWTIGSALVGIIIYGVLFILNTGILPVPTIILGRKELCASNRHLVDFTLLSSMVLIGEIVILVVLTEEGVPTIPHKFLFRYFQILIPLIIILFSTVKNKEFIIQNIKTSILIVGSILVSLSYFIYMKGNTRQAIIDGHVFLLLENLTKYIMPYADALIVFAAGGSLLGIIRRAKRNKKNIVPIYNKTTMGIVVIFWIINCIQLPIYTNYIAGGKQIQNDGICIANYLNANDYQIVYYLYDNEVSETGYIRNIYGYLKQSFCPIDAESELQKVLSEEGREKSAIVVQKGYQPANEKLEKIDLETERIDLYILN